MSDLFNKIKSERLNVIDTAIKLAGEIVSDESNGSEYRLGAAAVILKLDSIKRGIESEHALEAWTQ